jgi:hypothetical protein
MNHRPSLASTQFRPTLQFSLNQPILSKGQSHLILRREVATFRRKIGWRWLLDRIDWFAENCKIGRIWVDVGCDN